MAKLAIDIANLEAILTNHAHEHTPDEIQAFEEDLTQYRYVQGLWDEFGDIPMDPETECIEQPFVVHHRDSNQVATTFPAGTFREDIWHWFEETFCLSIGEDLMD